MLGVYKISATRQNPKWTTDHERAIVRGALPWHDDQSISER